MKLSTVLLAAAIGLSLTACNISNSDSIQRDAQEKILAEATAATGMPAIKNFRERNLLKDIIEMRDQDGLVTHLDVCRAAHTGLSVQAPGVTHAISL